MITCTIRVAYRTRAITRIAYRATAITGVAEKFLNELVKRPIVDVLGLELVKCPIVDVLGLEVDWNLLHTRVSFVGIHFLVTAGYYHKIIGCILGTSIFSRQLLAVQIKSWPTALTIARSRPTALTIARS